MSPPRVLAVQGGRRPLGRLNLQCDRTPFRAQALPLYDQMIAWPHCSRRRTIAFLQGGNATVTKALRTLEWVRFRQPKPRRAPARIDHPATTVPTSCEGATGNEEIEMTAFVLVHGACCVGLWRAKPGRNEFRRRHPAPQRRDIAADAVNESDDQCGCSRMAVNACADAFATSQSSSSARASSASMAARAAGPSSASASAATLRGAAGSSLLSVATR